MNICWFRRDLRLSDHAALHHSLKSEFPVLCLFIFDRNILESLENKADARVTFIYNQLKKIDAELRKSGSFLLVKYGKVTDVWGELITEYKINEVLFNVDYEPYAVQRDEEVRKMLYENGIRLSGYKDQVIFEKSEVVKENGLPYTVFTPYKNKWKKLFDPLMLIPFNIEPYKSNFIQAEAIEIPSIESIGFQLSDLIIPEVVFDENVWRNYAENRNLPALNSTTRLSVALRFGTVSIRQAMKMAVEQSETLMSELIWRDFFKQIMWFFPFVVHSAFRKKYDRIIWRNNEEEFSKWCEGRTGYALVDAGMRELNATGFMHNRVRMVTASFLVKDLLIDWRWGEAYFASKLIDFDLSSNNGNWQWAAGTGCDAAPYFRIFNPEEQQRKFDRDLLYVKRWIPEFGTKSYPAKITDHRQACERALRTYREALT